MCMGHGTRGMVVGLLSEKGLVHYYEYEQDRQASDFAVPSLPQYIRTANVPTDN